MDYNDTIVAQTTPQGQGGVGILRISGSKTRKVAEEVLGKLPKPRYASYLSFKDIDGTALDRGIALWFPKPNSFTGEDLLELQGHGSPVILDMLLERILRFPNIRIAKPGEFSERAFLNNKIDLVQAEAIIDLIEANSRQAARSSINSLYGDFSKSINYLINAVNNLRVYVEASIDFSEEEIDYLSDKEIEIKLNELINYLEKIRSEAQLGSLLRKGIKVVIAGYPNAGKSSLLNALARKEVAIVTNIAGTTRDVLQEHINFGGILMHITDTAGLRISSDDEIERIGIERTWKELEQADHILFVVDSTTTKLVDIEEIWPGFTSRLPSKAKVTLVRNKIDITGETPGVRFSKNQPIVQLSANTGDGIDTLRDYLKQTTNLDANVEGIFLARRRHLQALEKVAFHLKNGRIQLKDFLSFELFAEELRLAQKNLNEIIGKNISSDLLKEIFSRFCIGK